MSEAPKVIGLCFGEFGQVEQYQDSFQPDPIKYHHDDTVLALQAKVARLEAALMEINGRAKLLGKGSDPIARKALEETR